MHVEVKHREGRWAVKFFAVCVLVAALVLIATAVHSKVGREDTAQRLDPPTWGEFERGALGRSPAESTATDADVRVVRSWPTELRIDRGDDGSFFIRIHESVLSSVEVDLLREALSHDATREFVARLCALPLRECGAHVKVAPMQDEGCTALWYPIESEIRLSRGGSSIELVGGVIFELVRAVRGQDWFDRIGWGPNTDTWERLYLEAAELETFWAVLEYEKLREKLAATFSWAKDLAVIIPRGMKYVEYRATAQSREHIEVMRRLWRKDRETDE